MPLVTPLPADHDQETKELAEFFNETLKFRFVILNQCQIFYSFVFNTYSVIFYISY